MKTQSALRGMEAQAVKSDKVEYGLDKLSARIARWANSRPGNVQELRDYVRTHGLPSVTAFVNGEEFASQRQHFIDDVMSTHYGPDKASKAIEHWLWKDSSNLHELRSYLAKRELPSVTEFVNGAEFKPERRAFIKAAISEM